MAVSGLILLLLVAGGLCETPPSPCPGVFKYEQPESDASRWYGVATLTTDTTLHGLWLNVVLDAKADILGNWAGVVTTEDNVDFKVENSTLKLYPDRPLQLRFFIQYNQYNKTPRLHAIRLNGREICSSNQAAATRPFDYTVRPVVEDTTRVVVRPIREEVIPVKNDRHEARPVYVEAASVSGANTYSIADNLSKLLSSVNRRLGEVSSQELGSSDKKRPITTGTQTLETRPVGSNTRPIDSNVRPIDTPTDSYHRPIDSKVRPIDATIDSYHRPTDSNTRPVDSNARPDYDDKHSYETRPKPTRKPSRPDRPSSTDFQDYTDSDVKPSDADYFTGGLPSLHAVVSSNPAIAHGSEERCGKPVTGATPLIVNGRPTMEKMWPWQVALYQTQTIDSKYICGGTLIALRYVVTAAHCVTLKGSTQLVNKNTFTVFLGKHNLRTSVDGVQIRFLDRIQVHPQYNASVYSRDAAILTLRQAAEFTEFVRPACLWPQDRRDLSHVVGLRGSVVGWGFDEKGLATEELHLVEMPVVEQETCIRSYSEFFARFTSEYTFCAGRSVCNGDSGGGMVFKLGSRWHLRGLVSLSSARQNDARCDTSHYVIFTDLAKLGDWLADVVATDN